MSRRPKLERPCVTRPCPDSKCDHHWLEEHQKWLRICALSEVLVEMLRGEMAGGRVHRSAA